MPKYMQAKQLCGEITLSGDKSISHRALILAALSNGRTEIKGLNKGQDVMHMAKAVTQLGAHIEFVPQQDICLIDGAGIGCLLQPITPLYLGNSGTAARLLIGTLAPYNIKATFTGDASLQKRPMTRIIEPLQLTGAQFGPSQQLPLELLGNPQPVPIEWDMKVPSAQVKSGLLLAALSISGRSIIREYVQTRDHTEKMLKLFGADFQAQGAELIIKGGKSLAGCQLTIAGDFSSAAFLITAAILVPNSKIELRNIGINPTRTGFLTCLQEMGADIEIINPRQLGYEPVADIKIRSSALKAIEVPASRAALMIDEYPILATLAAFAEGQTILHGLEELKIKESNRLLSIAQALQANNVECIMEATSLKITGAKPSQIGGGLVKTYMDHRIAMSFLIMGLGSAKPIYIDDSTSIDTSFPEFFHLLTELGAQIYG